MSNMIKFQIDKSNMAKMKNEIKMHILRFFKSLIYTFCAYIATYNIYSYIQINK